jgi:divalent metal cation (Fe/Co/Zn/Cd) transporter
VVTGFKILKETTSNLMDEADFELIEKFGKITDQNRSDEWIDIHNFKLTKYGNVFHVNCDLVLPWNTYISDAHREGEKLEHLLVSNFPEDIVFNLHTDECFKNYCKHCKKNNCSERNSDFQGTIPFNLKKFMGEVHHAQ